MENTDPEEAFNNFVSEMKEKNRKMRQDIQKTESFSEPPKLSNDETLNNLRHTVLRLECEIQSLMTSQPVFLPNDNDLLLNIAKDESIKTHLMTAHALSYMEENVKKLQKEKANYIKMVANANAVDTILTELAENLGGMDYQTNLKQRYNNCGIIFKELRNELNWYLNSRFEPNDSDDMYSMEDLLEELTKKFLADPNDTYLQYDPTKMNLHHVEMLIKTNIISRHPKDCLLLTLNNFKRN